MFFLFIALKQNQGLQISAYQMALATFQTTAR